MAALAAEIGGEGDAIGRRPDLRRVGIASFGPKFTCTLQVSSGCRVWPQQSMNPVQKAFDPGATMSIELTWTAAAPVLRSWKLVWALPLLMCCSPKS